jgi:hypothetical protein
MDTNCRYIDRAQRQQAVLPRPRQQPVAEEFGYRFPHTTPAEGHREDGVLRHELAESSEVPAIRFFPFRERNPHHNIQVFHIAVTGRVKKATWLRPR